MRLRLAVTALVFGLLAVGEMQAQTAAMIDVGGHSLEVYQAGNGHPTVVFEAPLGFTAENWRLVFPHVAEFTSAVSYSRAGLGESDPAPEPRGLVQSVEELRVLLDRLEVEPPVVLVGHSIGGLLSRMYASLYPEQVAGLVLVDGTHERQYLEMADVVDGFWDQIAEATEAVGERGAATLSEWVAWLEIARLGKLPVGQPLPDVPMAVLTALRPEEGNLTETEAGRRVWRSLHDELFLRTSDGLRVVTTRSGHLMADSEPHLVVEAVRWVVDRIRAAGGG